MVVTIIAKLMKIKMGIMCIVGMQFFVKFCRYDLQDDDMYDDIDGNDDYDDDGDGDEGDYDDRVLLRMISMVMMIDDDDGDDERLQQYG